MEQARYLIGSAPLVLVGLRKNDVQGPFRAYLLLADERAGANSLECTGKRVGTDLDVVRDDSVEVLTKLGVGAELAGLVFADSRILIFTLVPSSVGVIKPVTHEQCTRNFAVNSRFLGHLVPIISPDNTI